MRGPLCQVIETGQLTPVGIDELWHEVRPARILIVDNNPFAGIAREKAQGWLKEHPWCKIVDHHGIFSIPEEVVGRENTTTGLLIEQFGLLNSEGWLDDDTLVITNHRNLDPDGIKSFLVVSSPVLATEHATLLQAVSRYTDHWMFGLQQFNDGFKPEAAQPLTQFDLTEHEFQNTLKVSWTMLELINQTSEEFVQKGLTNYFGPPGLRSFVAQLDQSKINELLIAEGRQINGLDESTKRYFAENLVGNAIERLQLIARTAQDQLSRIYALGGVLTEAEKAALRIVVRYLFERYYNATVVDSIFRSVIEKLPGLLQHPDSYEPHWTRYLGRLCEIHDFTSKHTEVDAAGRYAVVHYPDRPDNFRLVHDWLAKSSAGYTAPEHVRVYLFVDDRSGGILIAARYPRGNYNLNPLTEALNSAELQKAQQTGCEPGLWYGRQAVSLPLKRSLLKLDEIREIIERHWLEIAPAN